MCYVNYAHNVGNLNNPTEYLLQMVDKYHDYIHERKQVLFLALGTSYYFVDKNMKKASEYYLKAIELDPKSKSFTVILLSGDIFSHLFIFPFVF